jgi:uncharacterized protein with von Willebrand factor type A (vWA) domain
MRLGHLIRHSIRLVQQFVGGRMYSLRIDGLDAAKREFDPHG